MTKEEKIKVVAGLLAEGKSAADIVDFVNTQTDWGVGAKTVEGYITEANKVNAEATTNAKDIKVEEPELVKDSQEEDGRDSQGDPGDEQEQSGEAYKKIKGLMTKQREEDTQVSINVSKDDVKKYPLLKAEGIKKGSIITVKYEDFPTEEGETYGAYVDRVFTNFDELEAEVTDPEPKEPKDKKEKPEKAAKPVKDHKVIKLGKKKGNKKSLSNLRGISRNKKAEVYPDKLKNKEEDEDNILEICGQAEILLELVDSAISERRKKMPGHPNRRINLFKRAIERAVKKLK